MKRIEEELRVIRQQMEEDYLLHAERISAQNQSIERVERSMESVQENLERVQSSLARFREAVDHTHESVVNMNRDFQHFSHTTRSHQETWTAERKRNMRLFDVIQSSLLTSGLETESRLDKIEQRLTRLEDKRSGAA